MRIARVKVSSTTSRAVFSGRTARLASCNAPNDAFGDASLDLTLIASAIGARATTSAAPTPASLCVEDTLCIVAEDAARELDRGTRAAPKHPRVVRRVHHARRPAARAARGLAQQEASSR